MITINRIINITKILFLVLILSIPFYSDQNIILASNSDSWNKSFLDRNSSDENQNMTGRTSEEDYSDLKLDQQVIQMKPSQSNVSYGFAFSKVVGDSGGSEVPASVEEVKRRELLQQVQAQRNVNGVVVTIQASDLFEEGRSEISLDSNRKLDKVNELLKMYPASVFVSIESYADDKQQNSEELSEKRAQSVRELLVEKGSSASQLFASGKGSERPVVLNDSDENRQKNNRIEVVIYY